MTDDATPHDRADAADLAALLVSQIRQHRRVRLHWHRERIRHQQAREALQVALGMLRDYDRNLDRERATSQTLRDELRRYVAAQVAPPTPHEPPRTRAAHGPRRMTRPAPPPRRTDQGLHV